MMLNHGETTTVRTLRSRFFQHPGLLPSNCLFEAQDGDLVAYRNVDFQRQDMADQVMREIHGMVAQKDFPCPAAVQALFSDEYRVGLYQGFGTGQSWKDLRNDLLFFLDEQKRTGSTLLSFWAVFPEDMSTDEETFESNLWRELSYLTSKEERESDWPSKWSSNPGDKNFCFSLGGHAFFVVGVHPRASRLGRRFSRPALIFNVYDQFETLMANGQFDVMKEASRHRETRFEGGVNSMVEAHGENWESIQYSGKKNPNSWMCPFHWFKRNEKP